MPIRIVDDPGTSGWTHDKLSETYQKDGCEKALQGLYKEINDFRAVNPDPGSVKEFTQDVMKGIGQLPELSIEWMHEHKKDIDTNGDGIVALSEIRRFGDQSNDPLNKFFADELSKPLYHSIVHADNPSGRLPTDSNPYHEPENPNADSPPVASRQKHETFWERVMDWF